MDCNLCKNERVVPSPDTDRAMEKCPECQEGGKVVGLDPRTWTDQDLAKAAGQWPNAIERARSSTSMEIHMAAAQKEINRRRNHERLKASKALGIFDLDPLGDPFTWSD